jgi:hypothetical protein
MPGIYSYLYTLVRCEAPDVYTRIRMAVGCKALVAQLALGTKYRSSERSNQDLSILDGHDQSI